MKKQRRGRNFNSEGATSLYFKFFMRNVFPEMSPLVHDMATALGLNEFGWLVD